MGYRWQYNLKAINLGYFLEIDLMKSTQLAA